MIKRLAIPLMVALCCWGDFASAQGGRRDLIAGLDVSTAAVAGNWNLQDVELRAEGSRARLTLAGKIGGSYSLTIDFTRTEGEDSVGVVLPVGGRQCVFNLSVFNGEAHGIGLIDGKLAKSNETTIKPGVLKTGKRYQLLIEVDVVGGKASIASQLDGRKFLRWSGKPESLSLLDFWKLPRNDAIGLFTNSKITFHRIVLSPLDTGTRVATVPNPSNKAASDGGSGPVITFENRKWSIGNAESVQIETFKGRKALHIRGKEQAFVYLPETTFRDGTIEVDIASKTFSGIGFRGSRDGKIVEKLYFRPFNSGTAKHNNTVQYSMLGRPEYGWRQLRDKFPGQYESGADIKNDQWFHARIEIRADRLQAYVNDGAKPVLVVDKLLGDGADGVIGVWGWDSYFSNFQFKPVRSK